MRSTVPTRTSRSNSARSTANAGNVCHAIQARHQDVEAQTIEGGARGQAADAISAARPGARRESLEGYIKRLESLRAHRAESKKGVEKVLRHAGGP